MESFRSKIFDEYLMNDDEIWFCYDEKKKKNGQTAFAGSWWAYNFYLDYYDMYLLENINSNAMHSINWKEWLNFPSNQSNFSIEEFFAEV